MKNTQELPLAPERIQARRALRLTNVLDKVGVSRTQLYRLIGQGDFPRQFHLSARTSAWDEAEVDAWLQAKREAR
jgi:prophage regulatory protein